MSDWTATLGGLRGMVWTQLTDGTVREVSFATISPTGWPEARTVVLRDVDAATATLNVHTDLNSTKVASLRHTPRAALHIWQPALDLQIRMQTDVTILTGDVVADLWMQVPDPSRQSYGVQPAPGTPITHPTDYKKTPDPGLFAVLRCTVQHIDVVHLGDPHRRAAFTRVGDWAGQWLAP